MVHVELRDVVESDLPIFFEHQRDSDANRMAAFPAREQEEFFTHWEKIRHDPSSAIKTIVADGEVAGNVLSFQHDGDREIGYWLGKEYYGRGIATLAVNAFLAAFPLRPLYAHVAKHNRSSLRVLEKCGFAIVGVDEAFATANGEPVEGVILKLDA